MRSRIVTLLLACLLILEIKIIGTTFTFGSGKTYATPALCAAAAASGDTCDGYNGSYAGWTQSANGSVGLPITFQSHSGETVTITSTVTITNRAYLTFSGLAFTATNQALRGVNVTFLTVNGNNFTGTNVLCLSEPSSGCGAGGGSLSADVTFTHNVVNMNTAGTSSTTPAVFIYADRALISDNEIYNGSGDCFEVGGIHQVIRNNYCHDLDATNSVEHIDFIQLVGGSDPTLSFSLIENNVEKRCVDPAPTNCHFLQTRAIGGPIADTLIFRFNYAYDLNGLFAGFGDHTDGAATVPNGHAYNNTAATLKLVAENGDGVGFDSGTGVALNNLFYNSMAGGWSPTIFTQGGTGNNNIAFTTGYSGAWNSPYSSESTYNALRNLDPSFVDIATNPAIQATSPARDTGSRLTVVAAGDSGSGTSVIVNDARFFQAGWGVAGNSDDWIRVGSSTIAQLVAVNYTTNTLTLSGGISRAVGDAVNLYKDSDGSTVLSGSAPDIGAYEYGVGSGVPYRLRFVAMLAPVLAVPGPSLRKEINAN